MKQRWIITGIGMLLLGVTLGVFYLAHYSAEKTEKEENTKVAQSTQAARQEQQQQNAAILPRPVTATTPATLTLDYHFRIESDGPIDMMYHGLKKPVRYTPGKGFQQFPKPIKKGPKIFTDPKGGHIGFRIYAVPDEE
jgi:hypothetical protein